MNKPAVFLDRDGTIIEEVNYIKNVEDLKLIDGAAQAIKQLNDKNIPAIMLSNQSGVARGYFDETNVKILNQHLADQLKQQNAYLDAYYYCPHHPKGAIDRYTKDCECRKPKIGMITQALEQFKNIDLNSCFVIGDKMSDVELAKNAGCKGILLKTGYGSEILKESSQDTIKPDYIAENIKEAIDWVIKNLNI